jgi:hypothetical protein
LKHAVTDTLKYFSELFAEHHVRWVVVGALAANAYRLLRVWREQPPPGWPIGGFRRVAKITVSIFDGWRKSQ